MGNILLDLGSMIGDDKPLGYINYETLKEEHKEFLLTNNWDLEFLEAPHACYFPGNQLLKVRTTAVTPSFPGDITEIEAIIRQFSIVQSVGSGTTKGTISVTYVDREDQAIRIFLDDWRDKISNRENRFSFRKEDTIATVRLTHYNTTRKPIATFLMYAVRPQGNLAETMNTSFNSDDAAQAGEYSVTYTFEHFKPEWNNLPK